MQRPRCGGRFVSDAPAACWSLPKACRPGAAWRIIPGDSFFDGYCHCRVVSDTNG